MEPRPNALKKHVPVIIIGVVALGAVILAFSYKYGFSFDNKVVVSNASQSGQLSVVPNGSSQSNVTQDDTSQDSGDASNGSGSADTTTAAVSQDFFARYIQLEQNTTDPTTSQEQGVVNQVLQDNNINLTYKTYTQADLDIASSSSEGSITAYGNALGLALINSSQPGLENELVILGDAIDANVPSALAPMETHVQIYQKLLVIFTGMPVPPSAVSLHLEMVNDISQLLASAQAMNGLFTDPLPALAGVGLYNTASNDLAVTFGNYATYFTSQGITFDATSSGYTFTHLEQ